MTKVDFEYWVDILMRNFPDHEALRRLGDDFYPITPEEAHARKPPVVKMLDQDKALRRDPGPGSFRMWMEMMETETDSLTLVHKDGGELVVVGKAGGPFGATCSAANGERAECERLSERRTLTLADLYLDGHTEECIRLIRDWASH
jgi:hypothetical protein